MYGKGMFEELRYLGRNGDGPTDQQKLHTVHPRVVHSRRLSPESW